ncbi:MAG: DUF3267 domain-containing protein [Oscillospiraceae bacterium]|nr:DUF3267 domain-containing protein [Oscillospiraceae bacterium]
MKRSFETLPEGYTEIYSVNLQEDKKLAVIINILSLLIGAVMLALVAPFVPLSTLFDSKDSSAYAALVLIVSMILYIILHEAVHGITMKYFGCKKVRYGFTGLYAFAGCDDYFDKCSYIIIALAPVVLWGAVLAILSFIVPTSYFWVVYLIQITNISGAAGDFFVTAKFSKMPKDILVRDSGVGMTVYSKEQI